MEFEHLNRKSLQDAIDVNDWTKIYAAKRAGVPWEYLHNRHGLSALGKALIEVDELAVKYFLELGAPLNTIELKDGYKFSYLWEAQKRDLPGIADLLLKAGADVEETDEENRPLIQMASANAQPELVLTLCQHGTSPNAGVHGLPPLYLWLQHAEYNLNQRHTPEWDLQKFATCLHVIRNLLKFGAHLNNAPSDAIDLLNNITGASETQRLWPDHPAATEHLRTLHRQRVEQHLELHLQPALHLPRIDRRL